MSRHPASIVFFPIDFSLIFFIIRFFFSRLVPPNLLFETGVLLEGALQGTYRFFPRFLFLAFKTSEKLIVRSPIEGFPVPYQRPKLIPQGCISVDSCLFFLGTPDAFALP